MSENNEQTKHMENKIHENTGTEEIKKDTSSKTDKYEELKIQMEDYKNKYFRTLAEIENSRKRLQKEKEETMSFIVDKTISEFLSVIDNMENALNYSKDASEEVKNWIVGFQMILNQFKDILQAHGISPFNSVGCMLDPNYHEAVEVIETQTEPEGKILEEVIRGYKSNFRVLRPAHVKVAKKPINNPSNEEKPNE
jgi:molecular chaperone GrpE